MKKILITLICLLIISLSNTNAQRFTLHSTGFKDSTNVKNDYIVFSFTGKKQHDLYNDFYVKLNSIYVSQDDIVSPIDGYSITVNSTSSNSVTFQQIYKYDLKYNLKYTLTFLFKDGRVRVNAPVLNEISGDFGVSILDAKNRIHLTGDDPKWIGEKYIFSKEGELKEEKTKKDLEHFFNILITSIIDSVKQFELESW